MFYKKNNASCGDSIELLCCPSLQVIAAMDPSNWPAAAGPFAAVLRSVTDTRPKIRKRGQQGLGDVLIAIRGTPAAAPAGDALLKGEHQHLLLGFSYCSWGSSHTSKKVLIFLHCSETVSI